MGDVLKNVECFSTNHPTNSSSCEKNEEEEKLNGQHSLNTNQIPDDEGKEEVEEGMVGKFGVGLFLCSYVNQVTFGSSLRIVSSPSDNSSPMSFHQLQVDEQRGVPVVSVEKRKDGGKEWSWGGTTVSLSMRLDEEDFKKGMRDFSFIISTPKINISPFSLNLYSFIQFRGKDDR